jgi:hypothetical protein
LPFSNAFCTEPTFATKFLNPFDVVFVAVSDYYWPTPTKSADWLNCGVGDAASSLMAKPLRVVFAKTFSV